MRLQKFMWFNDTHDPVKLFKENLTDESFIATIQPYSLYRFELKVEDEYTVIIKEWSNGVVLLQTFLDLPNDKELS